MVMADPSENQQILKALEAQNSQIMNLLRDKQGGGDADPDAPIRNARFERNNTNGTSDTSSSSSSDSDGSAVINEMIRIHDQAPLNYDANPPMCEVTMNVKELANFDL